MSSETETKQAHCDRCGTVGEHLVCIKANRDGGMENWKPLCDGCLKDLGEWFGRSLSTNAERGGRE